MTHPSPPDDTEPATEPDTEPATEPDGAPAKHHGDPLLAASEGETEGTEGSRQGIDPGGRHPGA